MISEFTIKKYTRTSPVMTHFMPYQLEAAAPYAYRGQQQL